MTHPLGTPACPGAMDDADRALIRELIAELRGVRIELQRRQVVVPMPYPVPAPQWPWSTPPITWAVGAALPVLTDEVGA